MHPTAPFIHRQGEVDAWDNPDFRAAVRATGKSQIILAGIVTEVCTSFLALSLRAEGYEVFANTDASGTFNDKLAADANRRMEGAGVHLMGMFGIVMDLMRGVFSSFLHSYLPFSPPVPGFLSSFACPDLLSTSVSRAGLIRIDWRNTPGAAEVLPFLDV
jgi:hypothetical protein